MASRPRYVGLTGVLFAIGLSGLTTAQQQPLQGGVRTDVFSANSPGTKGWTGDISFHWEGGSPQADHQDTCEYLGNSKANCWRCVNEG
jgi:hypothetical protein